MSTTVTRQARCSCGRIEPSNPERLAFFEDCSEGSRNAATTCATCHYHPVAHTDEVRARKGNLVCDKFVPLGAVEFDRFYCGCRGWE